MFRSNRTCPRKDFGQDFFFLFFSGDQLSFFSFFFVPRPPRSLIVIFWWSTRGTVNGFVMHRVISWSQTCCWLTTHELARKYWPRELACDWLQDTLYYIRLGGRKVCYSCACPSWLSCSLVHHEYLWTREWGMGSSAVLCCAVLCCSKLLLVTRARVQEKRI